MSESLDEFLDDFGVVRMDDAAVESLLERARATGDVEFRRLAKEVQLWRYLTPLLLERLVPKGTPIDESDALLKVARFVVRGEGSVGGGGRTG